MFRCLVLQPTSAIPFALLGSNNGVWAVLNRLDNTSGNRRCLGGSLVRARERGQVTFKLLQGFGMGDSLAPGPLGSRLSLILHHPLQCSAGLPVSAFRVCRGHTPPVLAYPA